MKLKLQLFTNDRTPAETDTLSDYTILTDVNLEEDSLDENLKVVFKFHNLPLTTVYGWIATSEGKLLWVSRFLFPAAVSNEDQITLSQPLKGLFDLARKEKQIC